MSAMIANDHDLAEWRTKMAHALKASFEAAADHAPATKIRELEQRIRELKREGRERGFLPADGAQG